MKKHLSSKRIAAVAVAALALAGGGATLASTSAPAAAHVDPASELYGRLLVRTELPGFTAWNCPLVQTDARRWAQSSLSVEQLRRNGFAAGLRQTLRSYSLGAEASASVARYDSARGARSELENEIAAARRHARTYTAFPVPDIPGARGFTLSGNTKRLNVGFTDGRYLHRLSVGFPSSATQQPSKAQVVAAATALYQRIHER
jgi:hypothetical protein